MKTIKIFLTLIVIFLIYFLLDRLNKRIEINKKKKLLLSYLSDKTFIFDKAKFHINTVKKLKLDHIQAYVHTGYYISWLLANNLIKNDLVDIEKYKSDLEANKQSPIQYYLDFDGVFSGEDLTNNAYMFSREYFDIEEGQYLSDYITTLLTVEQDIYECEISWENLEKISVVLNKKFDEWKNKMSLT